MRLIDIRRSYPTRHWWFSLGMHLDFHKKYVDIYLAKWILTMGNTEHNLLEGKVAVEFTEMCDRQQKEIKDLFEKHGIDY